MTTLYELNLLFAIQIIQLNYLVEFSRFTYRSLQPYIYNIVNITSGANIDAELLRHNKNFVRVGISLVCKMSVRSGVAYADDKYFFMKRRLVHKISLGFSAVVIIYYRKHEVEASR